MLAPSPSQQSEQLPYGLVSLWDMLTFKAHAFYDSSRHLERILVVMEHVSPSPNEVVSSDLRELVQPLIEKFIENCGPLNAKLSQKSARRACEHLASKEKITSQKLGNLVQDIINRFRDEIEGRSLFIVAEEDKEFFENPVLLFGGEVVTKFPQSIADLEEAGKCLALDRHTASAFHLMRALEVPLQIFAARLLPDDLRPNWDPIIRKIDEELKLPHAKRSIKGDVEFYSNVSAHLHSVKLAWRNRINHLDEPVSPGKARDIFSATKALMVYLAENLPDELRPQKGEASLS